MGSVTTGAVTLGSAAAIAFDESRLAPAYTIIEQEIVGPQTPSAVLALARREGPIAVRAFGRARWQPEDVPARPDTIYLLASITKPFVATAVMQLVEGGRFLLDDPVARHLPAFAANGKARVTVRHLLTHTSGLDEAWVMQRGQEGRARAHTWEARVATICEAPLSFAPGSFQSYCNPPFTILAELVRLYSGLPIDAYLRAHVFDRLGMAATSFDPPATAEGQVAAVAPNSWPSPTPEPVRPGWTLDELIADFRRLPQPAGGLWSTAADLVTFGRACLACLGGPPYLGVRLLAPITLAAMLRPQTEGLQQWQNGVVQPGPVRGLGFALPGRSGHDFLSRSAFGHGGATGTQLLIDPEQDLIVVFLTNRWGWDARSRALALNAAIAGASNA